MRPGSPWCQPQAAIEKALSNAFDIWQHSTAYCFHSSTVSHQPYCPNHLCFISRLDDRMNVKVADFGLSRDIYERDYYSSDDRKAKLPVKWMALESLEKGIYNNKTDVVCITCSSFFLTMEKNNL